MKKLCSLLILTLLLAIIVPYGMTLAADEGFLTTAVLDARSAPALNAPILFAVPAGADVAIEEKQNDGWFKISYNDQFGYVSGAYIVSAEDTEQQPLSLVSDSSIKPETRTDILLKFGSTGSDVVNMQTALKELGYFSGYITGDFFTFTDYAVKRFQLNNDLPVTGEADSVTLECLYSGTAHSAYPSAPSDAVIKAGDFGTSVLLLQQALTRLSMYNFDCNGYFGARTEEAVNYFQQVTGLEVTGIANGETQQQIYQMTGMLLTAKSEQVAETQLSTPTTKVKKSYTMLQEGSKGEEVKNLQQALKNLYYFNHTISGSYSSTTVKAVKEFQTRNNLISTGIADNTTLVLLYTGTGLVASVNAPPPTATPSPTPLPTASPKPTFAPNSLNTPANLNITLKSGSKSTDVILVQLRLIELGYFSGDTSTTYGTKTTLAVKNFQEKNSLAVNGIADPSTLKLLFTAKALSADAILATASPTDWPAATPTPTPAKGSIELIDWFYGGSTIFARNSAARVIDVTTGASFMVKRMGGTNHADSEPLTAADAAIMQQIYGTWCWDRRPIIVEVNGHRIAASMNGMPHSLDWIANNEFVGHFCIHFLHSRTHGTNVEDAAHQAAVMKAYNSGI